MRIALFAATASLLVLAAARPAAANGRFPASNQLVFSPTDMNLVVLRTTFGILVSHDGGTTWSWLCEDALGLPSTSNEDPSLGLTQNNTLVAGLSLGVEVSPDTGCNWGYASGGLSQRTSRSKTSWSGPTLRKRCSRWHRPTPMTPVSTARRATRRTSFGPPTMARRGPSIGTPIDPSVVVTTIEVAATDPQRIYVSGFRGENMARTTALFVSADSGMTWTERPTPFDPTKETAVYIAAVDPNNADVVYVRSQGQSRLMVTKDAGKTYTLPVTLPGQMLGFALSPDGSKVYIGGTGGIGLLMAPSATLNFQSMSTIDVQCLAAHENQLWACSDEHSGFIAGVSTDDGATFAAKAHLLSIQTPLACSLDATATQCTEPSDANPSYNPVYSLCSNLGACSDAGPPLPLMQVCLSTGACGPIPDGGPAADAGGNPPPVQQSASKSSCGCSAVGGGGAVGFLASAALLGLAASRRRRAARTRPDHI